jgi:hypothetical protein
MSGFLQTRAHPAAVAAILHLDGLLLKNKGLHISGYEMWLLRLLHFCSWGQGGGAAPPTKF